VSLTYAPSNIEHQRQPVPQITGYIASSWLQFVKQPPADPSDPRSIARSLGNVDVPIVLRIYPANPALIGQSGSPTYTGTLPPGAIEEATQWTYAFTYSLPGYYPQDIVYGTVIFNVAEKSLDALAALADTFPWLAEFVSVYPDVARDLQHWLALITPATTKKSPEFAPATIAVQSVNAMLGKITGISPVNANQHQPRERLTIRPRSSTRVSSTDAPWNFKLNEAHAGDLNPRPATTLPDDALVITVTTIADPVSQTTGPVPEVQFPGYTTNNAAGTPVPGALTIQYYFTDSQGNVLLVDDARLFRRTVQYPTLRILDKQDAEIHVHVTRNENLVTGRVTNDNFVYRTAEVAFTGPCMPSILYTGPIDIAQIAPPKPPAPQSLEQQLTTLFTTLTNGASRSEMSLQLAVAYRYPLNAGTLTAPLPVTVPILMQPPLPVFWGKGPTPVGYVALADMIHDLSAAIITWFKADMPATNGGALLFSLTIMSSLTMSPMPLLRLSDLELALTDVDDLPQKGLATQDSA
jgi:hypothetical protein